MVNWLVVDLALWKMMELESDGMMKYDEIPNIWKNNPNVPNHQPGGDSLRYFLRCIKNHHLDSGVNRWIADMLGMSCMGMWDSGHNFESILKPM